MSVWHYSASGATFGSGGGVSSSIACGAGKFVIPAANGTITAISSSDGGVTWDAIVGFPAMLQVAYGAGIFVALGDLSGTVLSYATSVDGIAWTNRTIDLNVVFGTTFNHIGPTLDLKFANGKFYVFFYSDFAGASTLLTSSADGIAWTDALAGAVLPGLNGANRDITYGAGIYAIQFNASVWSGASLAGLAEHVILGSSFGRAAIAFGSSKFITIDDGGKLLHTSVDGITWTAAPVPTDPVGSPATTPINIQFIGGKFYCSVVDVANADRFFSSPDGVTWTEELVTAPPAPAFSALSFATDGSHIVGVDNFQGANASIIYTSTSSPAVVVPNVIDDTLEAAGVALTGAGLVVGALTYSSDLLIPKGVVLDQSPIAGSSAASGSAVSLLLSTGVPIAAKLTRKLLLWLHRIFDKDAHQQLALRLQYDGGMAWTIANGVLTTVVTGGSGANQTVELAGYTIGTLANHLATLPGYSVPFQDTSAYGLLSALVLLDSSKDIGTSNGDHVYGYTSLLWAYLESVGSELGTAKAQIPQALQQMSIPTAEGEWLDFQGSFYKVPRNQGELSPFYAPRIIANVLQPRGNNVAIAVAIQAVAVDALRVRVTDAIDDLEFAITYDGLIHFDGTAFYDAGMGVNSVYGFFDVDFSYDFLGSVSQATYFPLILSTAEDFRDAGTQLRAIIFRNLGSNLTMISDSFVGNIRVVVFDDFSGNSFRLLESGVVRLLENGDARVLE